MHIISRKVHTSVLRGVKALQAGTFTEVEVKQLMMDLRESARENAKQREGWPSPTIPEMLDTFVDVCDFIAHTNRTKGGLEERIRAHAEKIAAVFERAKAEPEWAQVTNWQDAGALDSILHVQKVVDGLLSSAALFLSAAGQPFNPQLMRFTPWRWAEIGLCIASLLQDSVIKTKGGNGQASLHLLVHQGFYRLYCRLHGSKVEQRTHAAAGGSGGAVAFGFPVLLTFAVDREQLLRPRTDDWTPGPDHKMPVPRVFETFRDPWRNLRLREIHNDR